jgi:hypothetical protein
MGLARSSKLKGFDAENQIADGQQQVEVLVEGDEAATRKFGDILQVIGLKNFYLCYGSQWRMEVHEQKDTSLPPGR